MQVENRAEPFAPIQVGRTSAPEAGVLEASVGVLLDALLVTDREGKTAGSAAREQIE